MRSLTVACRTAAWRQWMLAIAVGAAMTATSGCGTIAAVPPVDAQLPVSWPVSTPFEAAPDHPARVRWQTYFTDARLQALIGLALANNRDLRIAAAKVEQEAARYRSARADRLPTFNGQASESRTSTPSDLNTGISNKRFDLQGVFAYEIDFWGRVAAMSESARASFLASDEARREVYLSLISDVASAYFAVIEADELLALTRSALTLREQSLDIVTHGRDAGGAEDDERQLAFLGVESARSALAQLTHQRNLASHRLNVLVGAAANDLPAGKPLAEQVPGVELSPGLPSEVLLHRPDVMAAEQRLRAADADVAAARAAFMPKISLTAALGFASPALATLFSGGAWSYQPLVTMPLFDGGRTQANADLARARKVMAVADYEKTVQSAFRNVSDQLSARTSVRAQLDASLASERAQAQRLKTATGKYGIGMSSYRDVLEAQRVMLSAIQTTLQLRRAEQDVAAALYKALGGGADVDAPTLATADKPVRR